MIGHMEKNSLCFKMHSSEIQSGVNDTSSFVNCAELSWRVVAHPAHHSAGVAWDWASMIQ
eukprot:1053630-Karenia_brevis.AAC.1